jgi:hypothetical protein
MYSSWSFEQLENQIKTDIKMKNMPKSFDLLFFIANFILFMEKNFNIIDRQLI